MDNREAQAAEKLELVHVCEKCRSNFRPDQVNEDVNLTGVIECKVCSHDQIHFRSRRIGEMLTGRLRIFQVRYEEVEIGWVDVADGKDVQVLRGRRTDRES